MSEEKIFEEETRVSETDDESEAGKKKKFFTSNRIEIIVAIFLGITALLTAWATWIGSLHGANQATNYTKSNNIASEGNAAYNSALQLYLSDLMAWNTAMDYEFEKEIAQLNGKDKEVELIDQKLTAYIKQNCSAILLEGLTYINENPGKYESPFEIEGLTDKYFTEANKLIEESQDLLKEGQQDNANGDAYNLVNVIYSLVLFLLGIVGIFKSLPNRAVVMMIAIVGVILAAIYMFTIPLPTGFNFLSYFGLG